MNGHYPPLAGPDVQTEGMINRGWTKKLNRFVVVQECESSTGRFEGNRRQIVVIQFGQQ